MFHLYILNIGLGYRTDFVLLYCLGKCLWDYPLQDIGLYSIFIMLLKYLSWSLPLPETLNIGRLAYILICLINLPVYYFSGNLNPYFFYTRFYIRYLYLQDYPPMIPPSFSPLPLRERAG